jgi:hypothetical protein
MNSPGKATKDLFTSGGEMDKQSIRLMPAGPVLAVTLDSYHFAGNYSIY